MSIIHRHSYTNQFGLALISDPFLLYSVKILQGKKHRVNNRQRCVTKRNDKKRVLKVFCTVDDVYTWDCNHDSLFVCWLLNVPATGTDLLRQSHVLPHWDNIQLSTSPSHSILTQGRPVPVLTQKRQAPGRVATGVPILKSLVWLDPQKIPSQAGFEPGIFRFRGGRLNH